MSAPRKIRSSLLSSELVFQMSRSSGPGGQNVNKVNTKVTLRFDVTHSAILNEEEKAVITAKLATKMTEEGVLMLSAQDKRSQLQNKEAVLEKLDALLAKAFEKKKARRATKPTKSSVKNRMDKKKRDSEKKKWRQKP